MRKIFIVAVGLSLSTSAFSADYIMHHPPSGYLRDADSVQKQGGVGNYLFRYTKAKQEPVTAQAPEKMMTEDEITYEQSAADRSKTEDRLYFSPNSTKLKMTEKKKFDKISEELKSDADKKAYIYGYADRTGNPEYNETLSQKRAQAVYEELKNRGVATSQLHWEGRGIADADADPETLAEDRRVDIELE